MVTKQSKKLIKQFLIIKIAIISLFIIIIVPIIPVESTTQLVCVTAPCEDMVVMENQTILEFVFESRSEGTIPKPSPDEEVACIQQFAPVCTIKGTFSNQCEADRADAFVLYEGECP